MITGNKDVDYYILEKLDDETLLKFACVSKTANLFLNKDVFWRNRFINRFGIEHLDYLERNNAKKIYLKISLNLKRFENNPFSFFTYINWDLPSECFGKNEFYHFLSRNFKIQEHYKYYNFYTCYRFLNLGENITINFPIDYKANLNFIRRTYSNNYLSPENIMKYIYNFYEETISFDEFMENKRVENHYVKNIKFSNSIVRFDMMGSIIFEGFQIQSDGSYNLILSFIPHLIYDYE
jgi:hypothetical protein